MTDTAIVTVEKSEDEKIADIVLRGDIGGLSSAQQARYIKSICDDLGLDWKLQPFEVLILNGKKVLYAKRSCTEQLRKMHNISIEILDRVLDTERNLYSVRAKASTPDGRTDESIGAVAVGGKGGDDLANAIMKAESKSKRRVTLSICGLGMLDESEVPTIQGITRKVPKQ